MQSMQDSAENHETRDITVTKSGGTDPHQTNKTKETKKGSSQGTKAQQRGKAVGQNKAQSSKPPKSLNSSEKVKEDNSNAARKKQVPKERRKAEHEILRMMQRAHAELCAKYAAGQNMDILAMQTTLPPMLSHADAGCSDMELALVCNAQKPPDPGSVQTSMDMDSQCNGAGSGGTLDPSSSSDNGVQSPDVI